jgi:hypothetical protein
MTATSIAPLRAGTGGVVTEQLDELPGSGVAFVGVDATGKLRLLTGEDLPAGPQGEPGQDGAPGSPGATGATGATGAAGPNQVTTATATNITGVLVGAGSLVRALANTDLINPGSIQVGAAAQFLTASANLTVQASATRGIYVEGTSGSLALYINQSGIGRGGTTAGICVDTAAGGNLPFFLGRSSAGSTLMTLGGDGSITALGPVRVGPFTFATVPSASANPGATIRITDRSQRLATSDGTNWNWAGTTTAIS